VTLAIVNVIKVNQDEIGWSNVSPLAMRQIEEL